jgi:aryl-alcohol dehydrogenase-like predicted oxidoreductase
MDRKVSGAVIGIDLDVSRLIMGCAFRSTFDEMCRVFDRYIENGGNAFDTAYAYGDADAFLGRWLRDRGIRDDLVIVAKGAHPPDCLPERIGPQLRESLDRIGTDRADLYLIHHDDESVPVEEFVDAFDAERRAGRVTAYGVSNWSVDRLAAANRYADRAGRFRPTVLSNHFGLARVAERWWPLGRDAMDAHSRDWLATTGTPLWAWSAQSRGFFARADPADRSDPDLVRCYFTADNFERLARARALAERFGVPATTIALAYVLHQPFPTFALVGPLAVAELDASLAALDVDLTADEVAWLDLRDTSAEPHPN